MTIGVSQSGVSFLAQLFSSLPQGVVSAASLSRSEVVVASSHDRVDLVLDKYNVPYQSVDRRGVAGSVLGGAKYLLIGCGLPLSESAPVKIAEWVSGGGRLLTTERLLRGLLENAFLDENGRPIIRPLVHGKKYISADEDDDFPVSQAAWAEPAVSALLEGGERLFWKVKKSSFPIEIRDEDRVEVLASSSLLGRLFYGADALFVRFPYGQGEVLHLLSHWDIQELDTIPPAERPVSSRTSVFPLDILPTKN